MLVSLSVKQFIFIEELSLPFKEGMTALTGETGAGKSILCEALWFALGATADKNVIALNQNTCDIEATFNIEKQSHIQSWLFEKGYFENWKEHHLCRITRRLSRYGRHQLWINEKAATTKAVQWLKSHLVIRHGQYDQQRLLKGEYQRDCLDKYGEHTSFLEAVAHWYQEYTLSKKEQQRLVSEVEKQEERLNWLRYQVEELSSYQLKPNELAQLEEKQRQLSHAHTVLEQGQQALLLMSETDVMPLIRLVQHIQQIMQKIIAMDTRFKSVDSALERAYLEIVEAESDLRFILNQVTLDPEQLSGVNQRLEALHTLARKHNTSVDELPNVMTYLEAEYRQHERNAQALKACTEQLGYYLSRYQEAAHALTQARSQTAQALGQSVSQMIQELGMAGGDFSIQLIPQDINIPSYYGNEQIVFSLSASKGQPLQKLSKGASGGELSRLALIIQSLIVKKTSVSTVIFDEVDVGVGGGIAERMGHLLKKMSAFQQVLCITHLPQVAALADSHYCIQKISHGEKTMTKIITLDNIKQRIQEIARMSGGINVTDQTIAYAKSMLKLESDY